MMDHPTPGIDSRAETVVGLVLVGPPAAGKTTVRELLGDLGATTVDVTEAPRDPDEDDFWDDQCQRVRWEVSHDVPVLVVDGLRSTDEIDEFEDLVERALVVRIDTKDDGDRLERYIQREIDADLSVVDMERISSLEDELVRREFRERPYPDHHVSIFNDDSVRISELTARLHGLVQALTVETVDPPFPVAEGE